MRWMLGLAVTALVAVSDGASPWDCDALVPGVCGFPFPNNFWRSETGRVNVSLNTFPVSREGQDINPEQAGMTEMDGFSPFPMISTYFHDLDDSQLAHYWNIEVSEEPAALSILLEVDTGKMIPHWVELDHSADDLHPRVYNRSLIMWPAYRLRDNTTYIVAFRGLTTTAGGPVLPSSAFAALRDNLTSTNPAVEARRTKYDNFIFPTLAQAGISRSSLTLAWDFTTAGTHVLTNRFLSMREDAFKRTTDGIDFRITEVKENTNDFIAREIHGTMVVPWYLTMFESSPAVRLNVQTNDPNTAVYNGDGEVEFTMTIPRSLVESKTQGMLVQYGHGLFGAQREVLTDYLAEQSNRDGYILFAVNWLGMCYEDVLTIASIVSEDLTNFAAIPDRSHQGMLNALLMMRLASSPAFYTSEHLTFNGTTVIDPTRRHYYGNSQGGIYGSVYMALTTDVVRGVIGVPGAPYSLLLPRSKDFAVLFDILKARYDDSSDRVFLLSSMQLLWDRMEPSGYLNRVSRDLLPNTPKHQVLVHYGLSDAQVSWLGGLQLARSLDCHMFSSNVHEGNSSLYGFPMHDDAEVISDDINFALGFYWNTPPVPTVNVPPTEADTHGKERRSLAAQKMIAQFFHNGTIYNPCGGPCVNETLAGV